MKINCHARGDSAYQVCLKKKKKTPNKRKVSLFRDNNCFILKHYVTIVINVKLNFRFPCSLDVERQRSLQKQRRLVFSNNLLTSKPKNKQFCTTRNIINYLYFRIADYRRYAIFCLWRVGTEIYDTTLIRDVDRSMTDLCFEDVFVL